MEGAGGRGHAFSSENTVLVRKVVACNCDSFSVR